MSDGNRYISLPGPGTPDGTRDQTTASPAAEALPSS
jgi:hypothetical protein